MAGSKKCVGTLVLLFSNVKNEFERNTFHHDNIFKNERKVGAFIAGF